MEHSEILELYLKKDPRALREGDARYGHACKQLAMRIMAGEQDAAICLREGLFRALDSVSYDRPARLDAYLLKLVRKIAIDRYATSQSVKRGYSLFATILDELTECRPASMSRFSGGFDPDAESARAGECLTRFLRKQGGETRELFLCRYFYAESLNEIARRFGLGENRVKARLAKTRARLSRFLEQETQCSWSPDPLSLARGLSYADDALILAAHGHAKKARRLIPWVAAACVVAIVGSALPYLREVINTDLVLRAPDWNKDKDEVGDAEIAHKPSPDRILSLDVPAELAGSTITLTAVTETSVTLTLVKTTDEPLYAAVYDRMGDALACTDPNYKVDGVTIRPGRIKVSLGGHTDGEAEPSTELPFAAGTYTVVVDFSSVRNGAYPMEEYLGILAYTGKDGAPETVYFSLKIPETEAETETADEPDTQAET